MQQSNKSLEELLAKRKADIMQVSKEELLVKNRHQKSLTAINDGKLSLSKSVLIDQEQCKELKAINDETEQLLSKLAIKRNKLIKLHARNSIQ